MPGTRVPARTLTAGAVALGAVALGACSKIDYLPDAPLAGWFPPVVLMHRGGGNDCGPGLPCWPNTLPAVQHGFETLDGVEVDLQITADGTVWLGHDNETVDCAGNGIGCFQDLHDSDVDRVAYCDGAVACTPNAANATTCIQHYVRAEEVFKALQVTSPEKMISLDVKGQYCRELGVGEAQRMGDEVDRLVRTYGMAWRVMAESSQLAFLDQVKGLGTPIYTFIVSLGDVDGPLGAASRQGATGISFKWDPASEPMNASVVAGIHDKGFRIILWTIDVAPPPGDPGADIAAAWTSAPDVIETDEASFFQYVPVVSAAPTR